MFIIFSTSLFRALQKKTKERGREALILSKKVSQQQNDDQATVFGAFFL